MKLRIEFRMNKSKDKNNMLLNILSEHFGSVVQA